MKRNPGWASACVCVCVCVCGQGLFAGSCSSGCEGSGGVPGPRLSPYLERDLRDTLNQPTQRQRHQSGLCQTGLNQVKSSVFVRACASVHVCVSAHVRLKMYVIESQSQLIGQPAFIIIIITVITQPIQIDFIILLINIEAICQTVKLWQCITTIKDCLSVCKHTLVIHVCGGTTTNEVVAGMAQTSKK